MKKYRLTPNNYTFFVCFCFRGAFSTTKEPVIPLEEAFAIPTYVLKHTMNGQIWPEGDDFFHNWLMCPTLLIYGLNDKLISLEEEKEMEEVMCDRAHGSNGVVDAAF